MDDDDASEHKEPQLRRFGRRELLGKVLLYYGRFRRDLLGAVALLLAVIGLGLLAPLVLGQVIDTAVRATGTDASRPLWLPVPDGRPGLLALGGLFVGLVVVRFLFEALLGVLMSSVGIAIVLRLKEDLFRKVLTLDPGFFRDYPPGRLIARVESDTESLKDLFSNTSLQLFRALLTFLGIFLAMLWFDPEATLLVVPLLFVTGTLTALFVTLARRHYQRSRRYLAQITGHITEFVQGIEVVRHHDYGPQAEERLRAAQDLRYRADVRADFLAYGFWGLFGMFEVAAAAAVLWVGAGKVAAGTMSVGTLVILLEYLRQVFLPIQMLSEFVGQIQRGLVSAGRVFGILALEPEVQDPPALVATGDAAATPVSLGAGVRFEDVRFAYEPGHEVLRGVSFEIPRGKTVALVGASGGGKSTLVSLLLRFHDPSAGRITVDGVDLREVPRSGWRGRVALVPQEVFLFPGSLADNLSVFDPARTPTEIEAACAAVGASRLVRNLPGGLSGELAERGANLSHGERQLVSLARALVADPELLVLDEATSSVDPASERAIQASLERLLAGRTALVVAHRLSTIRKADQILVVQHGEIVERGTHDELWARGGAYRALATLQLDALDPPGDGTGEPAEGGA